MAKSIASRVVSARATEISGLELTFRLQRASEGNPPIRFQEDLKRLDTPSGAANTRVKHLNRTYLRQNLIGNYQIGRQPPRSHYTRTAGILDAPSFQFANLARWLVAAVCSASFAAGRGRGADVSRALSSGRPIAYSPRRPRRSAGAAGPTKGTTGAPGTTLGRRRGIGNRRSEPRDGRSGLSSGGGAACRSGTTHRTV